MHLLFNGLYNVIRLPLESFISQPYFFKAGNVNLLSLVSIMLPAHIVFLSCNFVFL